MNPSDRLADPRANSSDRLADPRANSSDRLADPQANSSDRLAAAQVDGRAHSSGMRGKLILALSLVTVIPLLVSAYSLYVSTRGGVGPTALPSPWPLVSLAALSALAGGAMLWQLLTAALSAAGIPESPSARPLTHDAAAESGATTTTGDKRENVEALMHAFSRSLGTVEQQ